MPTRLSRQLLEFLVVRVAPFLLRCDAEGTITQRVILGESRVPPDIRNAQSLRACLSTPVLDEWLALVIDCICRQAVMDRIVVLDGVAFDLSLLPATDLHNRRRVWISLMSLANRSSVDGCVTRHALQHHEWGALDPLSRCQLDTLRFITLGLSNQQIAEHMHRSKRAVEWHIRHIHRLLGASARECLARVGRHAGLDAFQDDEWNAVLATRPARRSIEEFAGTKTERAA